MFLIVLYEPRNFIMYFITTDTNDDVPFYLASYAAYNKATTEPPATEPPKTATTDPTGATKYINLCPAEPGYTMSLQTV